MSHLSRLKKWVKRTLFSLGVCLLGLTIWNGGWILFYLFILNFLPLNPPCTPEKLAELSPIVNQNFSFVDYKMPNDQRGAIELFVSEDDQYVIKLFKPRTFNLKFEKYLPFFNRISAYRRHLKDLQRRYYGCITAYSLMPKESGMIYYHLAPSPDLFSRSLTLIDENGEERLLDLDNDLFFIQKKVVPAQHYFQTCFDQKNIIKAQAAITSLLEFTLLFHRQGIMIPDLRFHKNFGFLNDKPIRLDVECICFRKTWKKRHRKHLKSELRIFRNWLQENGQEEVVHFFDSELKRLSLCTD